MFNLFKLSKFYSLNVKQELTRALVFPFPLSIGTGMFGEILAMIMNGSKSTKLLVICQRVMPYFIDIPAAICKMILDTF